MKRWLSNAYAYTVALSVVVCLSGCDTVGGVRSDLEDKVKSNSGSFMLCEEPRPQVCTMQYEPVCALYTDGHRSTKSNACSACGDDRVVKIYVGECASTH